MSSQRAPAASFTHWILRSVCSLKESRAAAALISPSRRFGLMPDDVGLARRDRQHPLAAAADEDRRARLLRGHRVRRVVGDAVVLARDVELLAGEATLDDPDRFLEAVDAHRRRVVGQAERVVVGLHPPRADAELEAAVGEQVDRRRFLREDRGMLVVVVEHERPDAQRRRVRGRHRDRGQRREFVAEVIGHEERRVAEVFDLAGLVAPVGHGLVPARPAPRTGTCDRAPWRRHYQARPVEPQPPSPRAVSSRSSTSSHSTASTRWITSWAMRSPA